jgi:hypothetical protein
LGGLASITDLVTRLRAEVDEEVNEPLDRLLDEPADRIEALEMAMVETLAECSWAKRDQWCGFVDCHCVLAGRALRHGPVPRRPDPTPDKINEAFKRATRS